MKTRIIEFFESETDTTTDRDALLRITLTIMN